MLDTEEDILRMRREVALEVLHDWSNSVWLWLKNKPAPEQVKKVKKPTRLKVA